MAMHEHQGSCGCGAVTFTYRCEQPLASLNVRACQCEYCKPRRQTYLSDPAGSLRVVVKDSRYLYAHRFGTGTADFMHCAVCNHQVFVTCDVDGHTYALVSAPALSEYKQLSGSDPVDYDGESVDERLQRRSERWIGDFIVESTG